VAVSVFWLDGQGQKIDISCHHFCFSSLTVRAWRPATRRRVRGRQVLSLAMERDGASLASSSPDLLGFSMEQRKRAEPHPPRVPRPSRPSLRLRTTATTHVPPPVTRISFPRVCPPCLSFPRRWSLSYLTSRSFSLSKQPTAMGGGAEVGHASSRTSTGAGTRGKWECGDSMCI
jgi:hypothetical protein